MEAISKFVNSMSDALEFNQATLSGCVDVVVVRQPDGSLKSTPFHVRFGKLKLLKCKNRSVSILVNNEKTNLKMRLGEAGEGFFEEEDLKTKQLPNLLIRKAHSVKEGKVFDSKPSTEAIGSNTNGPLLKMLKLNSFSSTNSGNTKAQTDAIEDIQESPEEESNQLECDQKADDLIFLDDEEPKAVKVEPMLFNRGASSKAPKLSIQRANSDSYPEFSQKTFVKTLRPSSAQLESLNLRQGMNTISYTVKSNLQGLQTVSGNIYLWSHDANIIISDIDGTITKSDVMGHLMSMVGKDWSQPGIAPLFNNIKRNGYHILYLTSRAIGQAQQTKEFVNSVYQDGKMLPHGPLFTSPDRMLPSVKREIVFKRPELFKMAVLKDIRSLFPAEHNPFHAGFGNRETDAIAYKSVGIPLSKVFIINPKGHIHHHGDGITKSYAIINTMIKEIFPGILKNRTSMADQISSENILNLEDQRFMNSNVIKVVS